MSLNITTTNPQPEVLHRITCGYNGAAYLLDVEDSTPGMGTPIEGGTLVATNSGITDLFYHVHFYEINGRLFVPYGEMMGIAMYGGLSERHRPMLAALFASLANGDSLVDYDRFRDTIRVPISEKIAEKDQWYSFLKECRRIGLDNPKGAVNFVIHNNQFVNQGYEHEHDFEWILLKLKRAYTLVQSARNDHKFQLKIGQTYHIEPLFDLSNKVDENDFHTKVKWDLMPVGLPDDYRWPFQTDAEYVPVSVAVPKPTTIHAECEENDTPEPAAEDENSDLIEAELPTADVKTGLQPAMDDYFLGAHTFKMLASTFDGQSIRTLWPPADSGLPMEPWLVWSDVARCMNYEVKGRARVWSSLKMMSDKPVVLKIGPDHPALKGVLNALNLQAQNSQTEDAPPQLRGQKGVCFINVRGLLLLSHRSIDPERQKLITRYLNEVVYPIMQNGKFIDPERRKKKAHQPKKFVHPNTQALNNAVKNLRTALINEHEEMKPEFYRTAETMFLQTMESLKNGTFTHDGLEKLIQAANRKGLTVDQLIDSLFIEQTDNGAKVA